MSSVYSFLGYRLQCDCALLFMLYWSADLAGGTMKSGLFVALLFMLYWSAELAGDSLAPDPTPPPHPPPPSVPAQPPTRLPSARMRVVERRPSNAFRRRRRREEKKGGGAD